MRDAWFVVEVYCFLNIIKTISHMRIVTADPTLFAIGFGGTIAVVTLAFFTFRGKRVASRLLAAYIGFGVGTATHAEIEAFQSIDVYVVYRTIVSLYFLIGAIKLWRIKELPTRFTDPPQEPSTH